MTAPSFIAARVVSQSSTWLPSSTSSRIPRATPAARSQPASWVTARGQLREGVARVAAVGLDQPQRRLVRVLGGQDRVEPVDREKLKCSGQRPLEAGDRGRVVVAVARAGSRGRRGTALLPSSWARLWHGRSCLSRKHVPHRRPPPPFGAGCDRGRLSRRSRDRRQVAACRTGRGRPARRGWVRKQRRARRSWSSPAGRADAAGRRARRLRTRPRWSPCGRRRAPPLEPAAENQRDRPEAASAPHRGNQLEPGSVLRGRESVGSGGRRRGTVCVTSPTADAARA